MMTDWEPVGQMTISTGLAHGRDGQGGRAIRPRSQIRRVPNHESWLAPWASEPPDSGCPGAEATLSRLTTLTG
jgi:hypothetical protein